MGASTDTGAGPRLGAVALGVLVAAGWLGGVPVVGMAATATFSNPAFISLLDNVPSPPYPSAINVPTAGIVTKVTVTLSSVSHGTPGDIDVLLVGPAGQTVLLMSDAGAASPISGVTLTFDDAATASLPFFGTIASGTYKPTNLTDTIGNDLFPPPAPAGPYGKALCVFNGTSPSGMSDSGPIPGGRTPVLESGAFRATVLAIPQPRKR